MFGSTMDKARAIETFLAQVEKLLHLPFITDSEMKSLYGEDMPAVLDQLGRINDLNRFCQDCKSRCCLAVRCEFFAPQFNACPIFELRPPICRMHYCHRFFSDRDTLLKDMSDVFFDSLIKADSLGSDKVKFFDAPPLIHCAPELIETTRDWIESVKTGILDPEEARRLILQETEKFRPTFPLSTLE
jgi:hypothetical protein